MIFDANKIIKLIKKNIEISFLFFLLIFTITTTTFYNNYKKSINENYKNIVNNIYFQKSINQIIVNLKPRYRNIDHRISNGETFDKILNNYEVSIDDINKIKKNLNKNYNLDNLKTNLIIKFRVDESKNKKVISFLFPVSRTEKIQLIRNLDTNLFEEKKIVTNLNKKIVFKEGAILQSLYKTSIDLDIQPNIVIEFARIYGF